jgi:uncharacterized repeat protein (TIGR03803 family)
MTCLLRDFANNSIPKTTSIAAVLLLSLILFAPRRAQAQTYTFGTIYRVYFATAGPTLGADGNLYGTTELGYGGDGNGGVFAAVRTDSGSGWKGRVLHEFLGGNDGSMPRGRVIQGPDGLLYGTTSIGGDGLCMGWGQGCGTVYSLAPTVSGPAVETVIYSFQGGSDGGGPLSEVLFDRAGNMYSTTFYGGTGNGTVFKLTRDGAHWIQSVIYSFTGGADGAEPAAPLTFDAVGNLYGTTTTGGEGGHGTVFELVPSGEGWTEKTLYSFTGGDDGGIPYGGVIFDSAGNIYGDTSDYGPPGDGGTAYELTPAGEGWQFTLLFGFPLRGSGCGVPGPTASLAMDSEGSLYGTTCADGAYGGGSVFKLTRSASGWSYTDLHDFTRGGSPFSNIVFDGNGVMYGTDYGDGVFEIRP